MPYRINLRFSLRKDTALPRRYTKIRSLLESVSCQPPAAPSLFVPPSPPRVTCYIVRGFLPPTLTGVSESIFHYLAADGEGGWVRNKNIAGEEWRVGKEIIEERDIKN